MYLVIRWILNALALLITSYLLSDKIHIADFRTALLAAAIIGIINTFIRPVLLFLTAPINFLTLGLFTFVINALVLMMAAWILGPQFRVVSLGWAVLASIVLSLVSTALSSLVRDITSKR